MFPENSWPIPTTQSKFSGRDRRHEGGGKAEEEKEASSVDPIILAGGAGRLQGGTEGPGRGRWVYMRWADCF